MANKKGVTKTKIGVSVDTETWASFDEWCTERSINRSKLLNKIIKEFLETRPKEEKKFYY